MKEFDVVLGNWPYSKNKNDILWNQFTKKFLTDIKTKYLVPIHPTGWRSPKGKYKEIQNLIKSNNLIYLNINDVNEGKKVFGKVTPFDWFILETSEYKKNTEIEYSNGELFNADISNLDFIPNSHFEDVLRLLADKNESTVEILYSRSNYGCDKKHMNREKTKEHIYPCVYSITGNDEPNFFYSNTNKNGHFGIPKLILGNGVTAKCFIDYEGNYGMTQFSYGIIDEVKNLEKIKKVLESNKFQEINLATKFVATAGNPLVYSHIISLFRKNFWKEFINN